MAEHVRSHWHILRRSRDPAPHRYLDVERTELWQNLSHTKFWAARGKRCRALSRRLYNAYRVTLGVFIVNVIIRLCHVMGLLVPV